MHFVLSYDLSAQGERRRQIETEIVGVLGQFRHIRRLTTFFIIHVDNQNQWEQIRQSLTEIARRIPEDFYFIMSPLMSLGRYNGFLHQQEWDEINVITDLH